MNEDLNICSFYDYREFFKFVPDTQKAQCPNCNQLTCKNESYKGFKILFLLVKSTFIQLAPELLTP